MLSRVGIWGADHLPSWVVCGTHSSWYKVVVQLMKLSLLVTREDVLVGGIILGDDMLWAFEKYKGCNTLKNNDTDQLLRSCNDVVNKEYFKIFKQFTHDLK